MVIRASDIAAVVEAARGLAPATGNVFLRRSGVVDQESLREWARKSTFERDFEGRVKGLGIAVYHWLVVRQGVDTVKPDVHVRRFAEAAVDRPLSDSDVVEVVVGAAHRLGKKALNSTGRSGKRLEVARWSIRANSRPTPVADIPLYEHGPSAGPKVLMSSFSSASSLRRAAR